MSEREWIIATILAAGGLPFAAWLISHGIADMLQKRKSPARVSQLVRMEQKALHFMSRVHHWTGGRAG